MGAIRNKKRKEKTFYFGQGCSNIVFISLMISQ